jgi:hypothetical protein
MTAAPVAGDVMPGSAAAGRARINRGKVRQQRRMARGHLVSKVRFITAIGFSTSYYFTTAPVGPAIIVERLTGRRDLTLVSVRPRPIG